MSKIRPLWLMIVIGALIAFQVYFTIQKTDSVHEREFIPRPPAPYSLFVPSPYELTLMNNAKEIWPRRFSPKQPPESSDLPVIYSLSIHKHPTQRDEIDFFRTLAMTATLGEWDTFKDILAYKIKIGTQSSKLSSEQLLKWVQGEKCSAYGQEVAFRLVQWDEKKLGAVTQLFHDCDPASFHALWFEVVSALNPLNKEKLLALRDKIQHRRERLPNEAFEFFLLTQAFDVIEIPLAHK